MNMYYQIMSKFAGGMMKFVKNRDVQWETLEYHKMRIAIGVSSMQTIL